jgi:signal transduction histidine kinase
MCWWGKLQRGVSTMAFCLVISALQYYFMPDCAYEVPLTYSLCIGLLTWALCDFGAHLFPSAATTGWPQGVAAIALPAGSMVLGFVGGTTLADAVFGWSSWHGGPRSQLAASIIISAVAGTVITYYFYSRLRGQHLERRLSEVHQQATEARLKLLEAQLDPHMLFNTLANLRALIAADPPRAQTMLDRMVDYLRATLSASRSSTHTLEQEFARLDDYLALMAIRMGARLHYALDLPDALRNVPIPTLLLQPLVENSIQHGLEPLVQGGSIHIRAHHTQGLLTLEVQDTGSGLPTPPTHTAPHTARPSVPSTPTAHGFGLEQVRERLATAYGAQAALLLIAPPEGGTRASITIPLQT